MSAKNEVKSPNDTHSAKEKKMTKPLSYIRKQFKIPKSITKRQSKIIQDVKYKIFNHDKNGKLFFLRTGY